MTTGPIGQRRRIADTVAVVDEELPQGDTKRAAVQTMFDTIAPRYDLVNRIMTFRMDVGWRRRAITALQLPTGATVIDLACGTGDLCRDLEGAGYRALGFDLSFGMLAAAQTTVPLVQADILQLPLPDGAIDGVTCGFALRNLVELPAFFAELRRVVEPGGRISLLDVAEPEQPVLRWGNGIYFGRIVPRIGGLLSDASAYRYLPRSMAYLPPPAEILSSLRQAGFAEVDRDLLGPGVAQLITATRA